MNGIYTSESVKRTRGRGLAWQVLGELSSAHVAAILIALVAAATWIAAYYERDFGMAAAHTQFYGAWWFNLLFILITVAVVGAVVVRLPLKRRQTGFAIVHAGLLLLIAGFWLGANRLDGMLNAPPGQAAHLIELPTDELRIVAPGDSRTWKAPFQPLDWAGYPSALRYLLTPLVPAADPGLHVLPEPFTLAALPDGTTVRVTRVADTAAAELGWIAAPGDTTAVPATRLELAIRPPGAAEYLPMGASWLTPDGQGILSRGPFTATLSHTDSADLVRDFLAAPAETAHDGRLVAYWHGQRAELAIDPAALPQQLALGDDLGITVVRVLRNPRHDGVNGLVQDESAPANPVLELAIRRGHGADAAVSTVYASAYSLLPPASGLPSLLYSHPQLAAPVGGGQGAYLQLLVGPDGRLNLRSFTRSTGAGPALTVPDTGWEGSIAGSGKAGGAGMDLRVAVRHLPQAVRGPEAQRMQAAKKDRATRWLEVEVAHGGAGVRRWLARGNREQFDVPGYGPVMVLYQKELYDLQERDGFSVVLDRFEAGKDPGGMGNASFASDVTVVDRNGARAAHRITMNAPLRSHGVTLYQTAFFPETDDQGKATGKDVSVFTVASDPGRELKYLGSLVLVAGILIMYLMRR